jgi:tetratricopeptide (TPR) repeat protein
VRSVWILALSLAAGRAEARPADDTTDVWREMLEPHGREVRALVARARLALGKPGDDDDNPADQRGARSAYQTLRHARTLAPDDPDVLGLLGQVADDLGKTPQALEALEACVRITGPERAGPAVTGRLGAIYVRLGKLDDAIRWLRHAQGPIAIAEHAAAAVDLAAALAARGEMASALDLLGNALPARTSYFTDPTTLVTFALAVHYDRDEQPAQAFRVLDQMQAALQQELGGFVQRAIQLHRFSPPEDRDYYQALLYEALGARTEARAAWAIYAQVPDAPWRGRALQHIRSLDAQPRATLSKVP